LPGSRNSGYKNFTAIHRSGALRRTLSYASAARDQSDSGANSAGTRIEARGSGILHLGWELLCAELTERLDVEKSGGSCASGLVHYNTVGEVDRLLAALRQIVGL